MNLGIFGGRLGKDAELNHLSSGDPVCNFSLANDVGTKQNPKTQWIECALFGKRAEALQQYLKKGTKVTVSGRVTLEQFTARDGGQKFALRLTVSEIDLHGSRDEAAAPVAQKTTVGATPASDLDDDLPF